MRGLPLEVEEDVHWRYKRTFIGGRIGLPVEVGEGAGEEAFGRVGRLSLDEFNDHVFVLQEVYPRVQVTDVYQRGLLKGWNML